MRAKVLLLAAVLVLSGAACARTLDRQSLEATLSSQLASELGEQGISVGCPDDVEVEAGAVFECVATGPDGATITVEVTQQDDDGTVEWRLVDTGS